MTLLVHAHGALFTSWVLLFLVQTALVAQHQVAVHRRLGIAGGILAGAMIVVGTLTALKTAARGASPAAPDPLSFLIIPLTDMILFGSFVTAALRLRKNREAHKRLMLLAYISIIVAAVARVPGILPLGPPAFFGLGFSFLLAGVIYDLLTRRRVHPVYIWGGAALIASVPLRLVISRYRCVAVICGCHRGTGLTIPHTGSARACAMARAAHKSSSKKRATWSIRPCFSGLKSSRFGGMGSFITAR